MDDHNNNIEQPPYDEMRDPFSEEPAEEEVEEKKSPNRTFIAILTVVGSIIILAIIVLIAFVLISRNRSAARFQEQADLINATNTAIAQQANETAAAEVKSKPRKHCRLPGRRPRLPLPQPVRLCRPKNRQLLRRPASIAPSEPLPSLPF